MTDTTASDIDGWKPLKGNSFMSRIGPLYAQRSEAGWRYGFQSGSDHANTVGLIHGGALSAIADQVMALVAWEAVDRAPLVTMQMDVSFLSAARPGAFLEAEARIVHKSGSTIFMETLISAGDRPVARASAVMKIAKSRPSGDDQ